jgi:hypothetical protein
MKRLTLNLPDGLLESVMALAGAKEKTEVIVAALRAYETALRRERLQALRGRGDLFAQQPHGGEAP